MSRLIAFAILFGMALRANAGLTSDDEARQAIAALKAQNNARISALEAASDGRIELQNQIEDITAAVAQLRGQIEVLSNSIRQANKQQDDYYIDLDGRLRKLEDAALAAQAQAAGSSAAAIAPPAGSATQAPQIPQR
jgi:chromosome segregation ATPase